MMVFLAIEYGWEHSAVRGVYADEKKANRYAAYLRRKELKKYPDGGGDAFGVEERKVIK